MNTSEDPVAKDVIMGLITSGERVNHPFQVIENIRREMIRQAEEAGRRVLEWRLGSFDNVG